MRPMIPIDQNRSGPRAGVLFACAAIIAAIGTLPTTAREPAQRPEIIVQTGHSGWITTSHFSSDGKRLVTGGLDGVAILWDVSSGRKLRVFQPPGILSDVVITPDDTRLLTCSRGKTAVLWDVTSGSQLRTFSQQEHAESVAMHPDGRRCAIGGVNTTPVVYDLDTGDSLLTLKGHKGTVLSIVFSRDGRQILTSGYDRTARLWDTDSGESLRQFHCESDLVYRAIFSPDDRFVLTVGGRYQWEDGGGLAEMILWDAASGEQIHSFAGHSSAINSASFSDDGRFIASGSDDGTLIVWDADTFDEVWRAIPNGHNIGTVAFRPNSHTLVAAALDQITLYDAENGQVLRALSSSRLRGATAIVPSQDGRKLYTGVGRYACVVWDMKGGRIVQALGHQPNGITHVSIDEAHDVALFANVDRTVTLWDLSQDRELYRFDGHTEYVTDVALSADGRLAASASTDESVFVWDAKTGRRLHTLLGHENGVAGLAFSPDSNYLATAGLDEITAIWNLQTGRIVRKLEVRDQSFSTIAFGNSARLLATGSPDGTTIIWDWKTGRPLQTLKSDSGYVLSLAFNSDASRLLTGTGYNKLLLWDTRTGELLRSMEGHTAAVLRVAFRDDEGRTALSSSQDGTLRIWDLPTGEQLLRLISLDQGPDWLAVTPEGLFDGSQGGRAKVSFRVGTGLKVVPVDRFFQDFYHPGLLAAIWNRERPSPEIELGFDAPPRLRLVSKKKRIAQERTVTIEVEAIDQGGGIARWALYQNDTRVLAPSEDRDKGDATIRKFQVLLVEGENDFRVTASNTDGSWEAEPVHALVDYRRRVDKPELYVVAVGVNRYAQESMNLKFATADAKAVADVFRSRGLSLYAHVHVTEIVDEKATRAGIQEALRSVAAKAHPQDALLVFFAGHGMMVQQRYYFVPHEFHSQDRSLDADLREQGLPVDQLGDWLAAIPALKRMLIFDTCQSGGVLGLSSGARNPFALRGAIERLSRAHGVFTIAAAASNADAQEVPQLKHGVLTYALLAALGAIDEGPLAETRIKANDPDGVIDVLQWFSFASGHVPRLTSELLGSAQDVQTSGQGTSFPVLSLSD